MSEGREHGDRAVFLDRLQARLAGGVYANPAHPPPPPLDSTPRIVHLELRDDDLTVTFRRTASAMGAVVHEPNENIDDLLRAIVQRLDIRQAVVTREPEAGALAEPLRALGVRVEAYDPAVGAEADLGVTGAVAAVAATGSVVVDSAVAGGRGASLLPRVHLCVVGPDRVVATPDDVLARFDDDPGAIPANLVLVTGPSRTGDIEQLLTIGVHGPVAVHIVLST